MFLEVPTFSLQHMPIIVPGPGIIIIREIDYNAIKKINKIRALGRGEERRRLPVVKERDFERV